MDLERRVEILEQELEILKNQIQVTLLDIREEVLSHKYPSLRSEERPSPQINVSAPTVKTVGADGAVAKDQQAYVQPMVNQVVPPPQSAVEAMPPAEARVGVELAWASYEKFEEWATNKLDEMGAGQIRQLIDFYTRQGQISPEEGDALLQLLSLIDAWNNDQALLANEPPHVISQPSPSRANGHSAQTQQNRYHDYDDYDDDTAPRNLVLKLISGVQKSGSSKNRDDHG